MSPGAGTELIQQHVATAKTGEAVDLGDFSQVAAQYSTVQYSTVQYSTVQYSTVQYSDFSQVSADKGTLIKLHATFMALAWLLAANVGTFYARYGKDIFMVSANSTEDSETTELLKKVF